MTKIIKFLHLFLILLLHLCAPISATADDFAGLTAGVLPGNSYVKASLVSDRTSIQPNGNEATPAARIGVFFELEKGWHIYSKKSGEAGRPTTLKWELPNGWSAGELQWPPAITFNERGSITTFGYADSVLLQSKLFSPKVIPEKNETITIKAYVTWLVCKDICIPGASNLETTIKFSTTEPLEPSSHFQLFEEIKKATPDSHDSFQPKTPGLLSTGMITALISAFIAGLILNLMPCVLPIISIKIIGFLKEAHTPRRQQLTSAFAFSAGILFTFFILACTINVTRSLGHEIGWGFQFQEPMFVFIMMLVVFILSLGFFDIYTFRMPYMQEANRLVSTLTPSFLSHFLDGILATTLSTPCTAPFLGTALAFAFTQSPLSTIAIFLSIGAGLASPYVFFSSCPIAVKYLPKPGAWMIRFRQLMGFSLLGTSIWLLFILDRLTEEGAIWAIALALLFYFCIWLGHWVNEWPIREVIKATGRVIIYSLFLISLFHLWPIISEKKTSNTRAEIKTSLINWQPFSPELLTNPGQQEKNMFIDFTADWCITCKYNKYTSIETTTVAEAFRKYDITPIKADWTSGDPKITAALRHFGGHGVPYYVIIPSSSEQKIAPTILPSLLTKSIIIDALKDL